jgi:ABC-type lipoprotein release transport system permease subunit
MALECQCAWADLEKVQKEITAVLADTQVVELASKARARKRAREKTKASREDLRAERERLAAILVPVVMLAAAVWMGVLAFGNVRERAAEIGVMRALGYRSLQVFLVFLSRAAVIGVVGGALGLLVGVLAGRQVGVALEEAGPGAGAAFDPTMLLAALLLAPVLSVVAGWIPAILAVQQDPADILRRE